MECDVTFQLKLPNFVEQPLERFLDNSYNVIAESRRFAATSLPLSCAPAANARTGGGNVTSQIAEQIAAEIKDQVRKTIEREARQWVAETGIQTIAASIPSGGIGGAAVLSTQLGQFIYRAQRALRPIIKVANDIKEVAEDVGFSTSCGWNNWHRAF